MMGGNNDDLDLRLALGYPDQMNVSKLKKNSGAGVNVGEGVDMTFAACDPLSELVWSPHKGLSLKCTGSSLADKKPFPLWNVGPSNAIYSPSESIIFEGIDEVKDIIGKGKFLVTEAMSQLDMEDAQRIHLRKSSLTNVLAPRSSCGNIMGNSDEMEKLNTGKGFEIVDTDKFEEQLRKKRKKITQSDKYDVEEESGSKRVPLEMPESSGENDEKRVGRNNSVPPETSLTNSKSSSRRRKGKERAFSDGNANSRMSSSKQDSHESVDSCNSANMVPQGKRRWHFEQPLFVGSKRMRKQMQGHTVSPSSVGRDSSFMTWISNMVNGFPKTNREEAPLPLAPAHSLAGDESNRGDIVTYDKNNALDSKNTGFQTMFHSLLCPLSAMPETRILKYDPSTRESKEGIVSHGEIVKYDKNHDPGSKNTGLQSMFRSLFCPPPVVPETRILKDDPSTKESKEVVIIEASPISCHRESSGLDEQIFVSSDKVNSISGCPSESKATKDSTNRNASFGSLWITRFCSRDHQTALNLDEFTENIDETADCSPNCTRFNPNVDQKGQEPMENTQSYAFNADPSPKFKSSEAMASMFARRLDAIKHIVPSTAINEGTFSRTTCFFCGRRGHDLLNCSEVTETELESLLTNVGSYDGTEDFHSLCIRCLQLDHWAITCPVKSSNGKWIAFERMVESSKAKQKMANGNDFLLSSTFGSNEIGRIPKGAFDAIRRLSLSRGTILKWINSKSSLSCLDGFFLRLRIGKQEAELGGTGYYVARIAGTQQENLTSDSKKFIPVNVGGIKCFVGCQYVSNHDFMEDELLAWWCKTSESGGKVPSEDEFRLKLEERKKLGF